MPRCVSTDISPQLLTPPMYFQASFGHVSYPNSPGRGTVWNVHTSLPVSTSYARMSPGGDMYPSPVALPTMTRFSNTSPGVFDWMVPMLAGSRPSMPTRRSTTPLVPNDMTDLP